jgi:Zn-dependent peptidase ImmA (M78 family)/transcriptional regulator with XRE-family HTH domain
MAIDQQELARRLREAREASGLRQEDVAQHLGLSRPSVAQIELGNRAVGGLELAQLARLFGLDLRDLLAEEILAEDSVLVLFRAAPEIGGQEKAIAALRESVALSRELANLESLLGLDRSQVGPPVYAGTSPRTRWQAIEQGGQMAAEERQRLGLGDRPLGDAANFLEEQGIRTLLLDLPDEVSGLTLMQKGLSLSVVVNRLHHYLRRRFSWTHEYAHVLLDRHQQGTISVTSRRDDLAEVRANAFAASFLLPGGGVRSFLLERGKALDGRDRFEVFDEAGVLPVEVRPEAGAQRLELYDVVLLAHHFQVSRTAALYRLHSLRILSAAERDRLLEEEKAGKGKRIEELLGLPQPDHSQARNEFRLRFLGLALEAYRREKISRGKLREIAAQVDLDPADLELILTDPEEDGAEVLLPDGFE